MESLCWLVSGIIKWRGMQNKCNFAKQKPYGCPSGWSISTIWQWVCCTSFDRHLFQVRFRNQSGGFVVENPVKFTIGRSHQSGGQLFVIHNDVLWATSGKFRAVNKQDLYANLNNLCLRGTSHEEDRAFGVVQHRKCHSDSVWWRLQMPIVVNQEFNWFGCNS